LHRDVLLLRYWGLLLHVLRMLQLLPQLWHMLYLLPLVQLGLGLDLGAMRLYFVSSSGLLQNNLLLQLLERLSLDGESRLPLQVSSRRI
jgi:hypothetical protein